MQKTILIPTDFTIESLSLLKVALQENQEDELNILLVHGYATSQSITEMLFYSPARIIAGLQGTDFKEACDVMQNRLSSRIRSIKTLLFTGKSAGSFRQFAEVHKVDKVVVPTGRFLVPASEYSVDLLPFLEKCNREKILVEWEARPLQPEKDRLAALFAL